jgi:hypothetical protein
MLVLFHPKPARPISAGSASLAARSLPTNLVISCTALAVVIFLRSHISAFATLCPIAMFIFAVSWVAFDTAAGVVTGILVEAAKSMARASYGDLESSHRGR